jgi:SAM-dependent methyltransferase
MAATSAERAQPHPNADADTLAIYGESYAAAYPALYLVPWKAKHARNLQTLERVLGGLAEPRPIWLDLACGQAWHFSAFPHRARMIGLDLSPAQLERARRNAPHAEFMLGNMAGARFASGSFDLVTNFWGGYCYLADRARIATLWRSAVDWVAPGGALYIEVLLGHDLADFNRSRFAGATGFRVEPRSEDYSEWAYEDVGGRHVMTSPPLEEILEIVSPAFETFEAHHDGMFMVHLVATGRR